jgi:hypothetical protein
LPDGEGLSAAFDIIRIRLRFDLRSRSTRKAARPSISPQAARPQRRDHIFLLAAGMTAYQD